VVIMATSAQKENVATVNKNGPNQIEVPPVITVRDLADLMQTSPIDVIRVLMNNGIMANINQQIDFDTVSIIGEEMGYEVVPPQVEEEAEEEVVHELPLHRRLIAEEDPKNLQSRPPVVTVLGHVDHGKTTLLDALLKQTHVFRENQEEFSQTQILDSNDLEKERGITISAKNCAIEYEGTKINIIDTPGHADFGGEVERVLNMADGVLLLVDAFEGPMPQTRFVLQKALSMGLKPCVVINKVDKPNCTPEEVHEQVFDLMFELGAEEWQLDFPVVYGSAKENWMGEDFATPTGTIAPLLDMVLEHIPTFEPKTGTTQMLVTSLDFSSYTGRIAIGRLQRGHLNEGQAVTLVKRDGRHVASRIKELYTFEGLGRSRVQELQTGDIGALVGLEGFDIGDTIADKENPEALGTIAIDEPTMSMLFTINDSPFFGQDGKFVTSRHIKERLEKELEKNLALRVKETDSADKFMVYGRGVLHLSVLIETMRREG